jgi:hypothetical protein
MRSSFKWRICLGAAFAVVLAASTTVALAHGTAQGVGSHDVRKVRDVSFELVGQVRSSAPGVSPATSIQYGYLSDLGGLPVFKAEPQNESTALLTFYTDTTTSRVIDNGPIRVINREGTMTIYSDPTAGGSFANPDSFRDGTPVLVARLRQQVIVDTTTSAFTAQNLNTIIATGPFQGPSGTLQLGMPGDRFRTIISGHVNAAGPPSAYMAGYTNPLSDLPRH